MGDQTGETSRALRSLSGKDLACWCALDQPCHADALLALANPPPDSDSGPVLHAPNG
jgi:hypothetical protein